MNLILVDTIDIPLKTRYERISTCLDSSSNVSFLIMPRIAWVKIDLETTYYSRKYQQSALAVCLDITTALPQLRPALIPSQIAIILQDAIKSIGRFHEIPLGIKTVAPKIFSSLQFVAEPVPRSVYSSYAYSQFPPASSLLRGMDAGALPLLGIDLRRIGKNKLDQSEMTTTNQLTGQKMQIFHTCLLDEIGKSSKPYSLLESYTLKLKGWMSILSTFSK